MEKKLTNRRKFTKGGKKKKSYRGVPKESVTEFLQRGGKVTVISLPSPEEVLQEEISRVS